LKYFVYRNLSHIPRWCDLYQVEKTTANENYDQGSIHNSTYFIP